MTSPTVLIKDTLVHDGFVYGGAGDWAVYIGKQPQAPDRCITVYLAGGLPPNPKWLLDYPSVQVRVRGGQNDYILAEQKAIEIRNRLVGRESYNAYDALGDRVDSITGIGDVAFVGWGTDELVRPEFVFNIRMIVEPSPTTPNTNREPLPGV